MLRLLESIYSSGVSSIADVIVSDNDPCGSPPAFEKVHFSYHKNSANLSAGANILKAFESCNSEWIMVVGDDDEFGVDAMPVISDAMSFDSIAVKFSSALFAAQPSCLCQDLDEYLSCLLRSQYDQAFSNLIFISNWLFRRRPFLNHISLAYLGYSSKISHLFPVLAAASTGEAKITFSSKKPIIHGVSGGTWPKAPTFLEIFVYLEFFSYTLSGVNRRALKKLLLCVSWPRVAARMLRLHSHYRVIDREPPLLSRWKIHLLLSLSSFSYLIVFLILFFPLMFFCANGLPPYFRKLLGPEGSVDRW